MRKFLTALVVVPVGLLFVVFAVANRHAVTVSFNPFDSADPDLAFTLPLFVIILGVGMLGVFAGGIATWIGQHRWRRAARLSRADAIEARAELAERRAADTGVAPAQPLLFAPAAERDRSRATL